MEAAGAGAVPVNFTENSPGPHRTEKKVKWILEVMARTKAQFNLVLFRFCRGSHDEAMMLNVILKLHNICEHVTLLLNPWVDIIEELNPLFYLKIHIHLSKNPLDCICG